MARHLNGAIAERSRMQLGLLTDDQARELGLTPDMKRLMLSSGELLRWEQRVLRVAAAPRSWEQDLLAGVLGLGPGAVVSHMAAAALHRFENIGRGAVELTVRRGNRNRSGLGKVHSSLQLEAIDLTRVGRFPATSVSRTVVDIAHRLGRRHLEQVVDALCRDRLTTEAELEAQVGRLRRPGNGRLLYVLGQEAATGRPHSWLERRFLDVVDEADLPRPTLQVEVHAEGTLRRLDACWEPQRLVVEVSGHRTHATRRQRQDDAERRRQLDWEGYQVLEFTYEDVVERPQVVIADTTRWLARRDGAELSREAGLHTPTRDSSGGLGPPVTRSGPPHPHP